MTLDGLPDLDTSGLCLVKTLSTALTCWPYRNTALRDGVRTSTRTSSVAKGRTASTHRRPAPPRQTEALSSRTSRLHVRAGIRGPQGTRCSECPGLAGRIQLGRRRGKTSSDRILGVYPTIPRSDDS